MKKIVLITGATQGIGKVTATLLAKQGHHVIIHGRDREKLNKVRDEIQKESANNTIDIAVADLLSMADTKRMADELKEKYTSLDVLINNAGAFFNKTRETTKEGFEKTIALNLLSPVLLIQALMDLLKQSKSARVINLSSAMHRRGGKPDFNDFQLQNSYTPARAYGLSKLYLIWATGYLAKQLKSSGINNITINATHPGAVATNFGQDSDKGFIINIIFRVALLFLGKPEEGARTSIYLATSPEVQNVSGQFYDNKTKIEKPEDKYYSVENEQKSLGLLHEDAKAILMKKHFLILILITAMTVSKAQIQGRYAIQNVHTGKNIRPFEAGKQDGNQIILYNHHAWKCMTWEFSQVNGDIYHLSNRYTEKTFQPKTAAISGVPLVQKSIEAGSNTEWEFLLQDDKTYLIRLRDTELYLTISSEKVNSDIILAFKKQSG